MAIRIRGGAFLFRIAYYHFGVCLYLLDYTSAFFGWRVQQHVRGVVDFLSAGRSAGRYLVCNAVGQVSTGAVGMIAPFEMTYKAGFAINWWQAFVTPVAMLVALTGFVIYRFRQTRALTLVLRHSIILG